MSRRVISQQETTHPETVFETQSKDLILGLMGLGHRPFQVEADGKVLFYQFDRDKVRADVNRLLSGEDVFVSYHKFIAAGALWAMNLQRANESRGE